MSTGAGLRGSGEGPPRVPMVVLAGLALVLGVGGLLVWRAHEKINTIALASTPKPVTVVAARNATFRETRTYVGTLRPWIEANVGPQFISAYVDTVLVRPGAIVKRGEVLATLDCRNASASSQAVAAEARAIDARQQAIVARVSADPEPSRRRLRVARTRRSRSRPRAPPRTRSSPRSGPSSRRPRLEVSDCVLRAPFDGEVATRTVDPGAFVRPGHGHRLGRRPQHRADDVRRPGERLRRRGAGHARLDSRHGDRQDARRNDRAALAERRSRDAHRPLRDRSRSTRSARSR